jgi:hypothetical protein
MTEVKAASPEEIVALVRDMIKFDMDGRARKTAKARENAGSATTSSWSVLDDLAEAYGWAEIDWKLESVLENVDSGRFDLLEGLTRYRKSLLEDLLRARTANSTSAAANLISLHKLEAMQKMYQQVDSWLIPLNAM